MQASELSFEASFTYSRRQGAQMRSVGTPPSYVPLQPAALPEEDDQPHEQDQHHARDLPEGGDAALSGDADVHAPDARQQCEREDDDADRGEHPEDVVEAMRDHRLVGLLERLCDLLVVLRSEEHTSELQSHVNLVCRLLLEKKKKM